MLKIAIAAGLILGPAALLAQTSNDMNMNAAASSSGSTHHKAMHRSTTHSAKGQTTRGASLSNDTPSTPNTSNSKSGPLNSNPH